VASRWRPVRLTCLIEKVFAVVATVSVRYIVYDVDRAIAFYRDHPGFQE